jgi:hypothetical protein
MHTGRNGDRNMMGGDRAIFDRGIGHYRRGDRWLPDRWVSMPPVSAGGAGGGPTLADSWDTSHLDSYDYSVDGFTDVVGQVFTSTGGSLSSVKLQLKKVGTPVVSMVARLWNTTGTPPLVKGTGSAIAASANMNSGGISTSGALYEFTFTPFALTNGTRYVISLTAAGVDNVNKISLGTNFNNGVPPQHSGNACVRAVTGSVWTADDLEDLIFYLYTT